MDKDPDGAPAPGQRRSEDRFQTDGEAFLRREGSSNYRVRVFDISERGCKVETVERPGIDEGVWIRFDGLSALHGAVTWVAPPLA